MSCVNHTSLTLAKCVQINVYQKPAAPSLQQLEALSFILNTNEYLFTQFNILFSLTRTLVNGPLSLTLLLPALVQ